MTMAAVLLCSLIPTGAAAYAPEDGEAADGSAYNDPVQKEPGSAADAESGGSAGEETEDPTDAEAEESDEEEPDASADEEAGGSAGDEDGGFTISMGGDVATYADNDMLTLDLEKGQNFKIRGVTRFKLTYNGKPESTEKTITITLPPFFKFVTIPQDGSGYTVESKATARGNYLGFFNGVPLPKKYYTAEYGTDETNAAELLAYDKFTNCDQIALSLDSDASSRRFEITFAIQMDDRQGTPDYAKYPYTISYIKLGELMVQAGAHCGAIPLNVCTSVSDTDSGYIRAEAVYKGSSKLTDETGTVELSGDFARSFREKAPEGFTPVAALPDAGKHTRPRVGSVTGALYTFDDYFYPYTDVQVYYPVSEGCLFIYNEAVNSEDFPKYDTYDPAPLEYVESLQQTYEIVTVTVNGKQKQYYKVYDTKNDENCPNGYVRVYSDRYRGARFTYVLPDRDSLIPGQTFEFGDILISYTHKGVRTEFETIGTINPYVCQKEYAPEFVELAYSDTKKDFDRNVMSRPQGQEDSYYFALYNTDRADGKLCASYKKAHLAYTFPWEISPQSVEIHGETNYFSLLSLNPSVNESDPESIKVTMLPETVSYYYFGDKTEHKIAVNGNRTVTFPKSDQHIETIVFNYEVLPAYSVPQFIVKAENMSVNQKGEALPDKYPCRFGVSLTTDPNGGGRYYGTDPDNGTFEPTEDTPWILWKDNRGPDEPVSQYGVYLTKTLDTLMFGILPGSDLSIKHDEVQIDCHDQNDFLLDSRNTSNSSPYALSFGLRKLDDNTKDYANVKITLEPKTEADAGAFSLISGLESTFFTIGEECDKLDIYLYTNLYPDGRKVDYTKYNPGAEHNEVTSYQWKFDLADGEYPTKIVIDLGTIHTNAKRFPATRKSGLRDGQILGGKYSTSFDWGSVPYFNVRFKGSSTFFTGSEQETPVPDGSEYKLKAKISTDTPAKFINGKESAEGVGPYDTVEGTVHFKSRFDAWLGYKNQEAMVDYFKENGITRNYTAYQGSNVSFQIGVPYQYNSINYSGQHFYTSADMKTVSDPLQTIFSQNNYYSFPGKVYFQVPRGIQFNSVKAETLYQCKSNPVELTLSQVKELANGDSLYIYEGDMSSIPGAFSIDATILPGAETGKYALVKDWGLSMDGFAQKYMQEGYENQYPYYTYHFTESFPKEWGVDDRYVLKAAPTAQKVEVLSASIDGILLRPGKDGTESTLTVDKPFTHYYQLFGEGQKNSLLGSVTLFNGGTSALNEYQAEIELPRSGGKAVGYLSNGEAQEVTNDFSLYLSGAAAVKASDKIQGLTVTYLDDARQTVNPQTAEDYAGVRYIQVSFRDFQPKDSIRLTLPLMTDYEKTEKAPEYAYLSASGRYKQDADSQWGELKAVNPVAFRFDSARVLVVKKEVTGSGADKTKAFEFNVTVSENGTSRSVLPYHGLGGLPDGVYITGYDQYISLIDGQGVEFYDLQPDAEYTVEERNYSKDGYYTSYTRQTEETTEQKTAYTVKGTLDYGTHTLTFTNYKGPVATWTLTGTKMVNGKAGGENFSFYREPCDENGKSSGSFDYVNNYVNSAGDTGELRAKDITFTTEGDYWYKLYESSGGSIWYTYDDTVYLIRVHVFMDGQDMKAEPHYFVLGEDGSKTEAESIVFHNIKAKAAKVSYHWVGDEDTWPTDTEIPSDPEGEPIGRAFMAQPQEPSYQHKVFAGWYTDEACTKPYANGSILKGNLDLYGYWTEVDVGEDEILVSYLWNLWYGDGTPTDVTPPTYDVIKAGTYYTPKEQEPSVQGFTFDGWYDWDGNWSDYFTGDELDDDLILFGYWTKDDVGSLTVSKTVTGSGSQTKAFTFTVTLTDESGEALSDAFSYTGTGVPDGTIASGGTVSLAHGQSVTITGLPAGTRYSVTENEANQGGYTTTGTNTAGTIQTDTTAMAAFVNYMPSSSSGGGTAHTSLTVKKQWAGDANRAQPDSVSVQLYRDGSAYGKPVELSAENRWSYTWTGLSTGSRWTVDEEDVPAGYIKTVSHSGAQWLITNTYDFMLNTKDHYAYIIGYRDGTVRPRANITRAEVATVFFRMLTDSAREKYWSTRNSFSDVSADDWCNNAISTMEQAGIISGYADGTFRPYAPITRAELVKIAVGFFKLTGHPAIESKFTDIQGHWAENYILFAAELGLVDGYLDGTFAPDKLVTRCEAMKIINHALGRAPEKDHLLSGMTRWPDNADTSAWFYAEVQEATNSHACDWISGDSAMESWTKILPVRDWAAFETAWAANSGSVPDVPNPGEVVD